MRIEMRTMNFPHSDQQIIEMCADIVDVLSESINEDSLHALVSIFIELSDLPSGSAFTIDLASAVDVSLALSTAGTALETHSFATPSQVAFRCMQTLQSEFAITAYDSAIQYDYAFPLRVRGEALGAITLHGAHTHLLSEFTISTLQNMADIAATSLAAGAIFGKIFEARGWEQTLGGRDLAITCSNAEVVIAAIAL